MRYQRGISLSKVAFLGVGLVLVASLGMKIFPSWVEYSKTLAAAKGAAQNATPTTTVPEVRKAYSRQAEIDNLKVVKPEDLDITKDGGQIVITFSFNEKIPLFGPASLLIEYQGSTVGKNKGE